MQYYDFSVLGVKSMLEKKSAAPHLDKGMAQETGKVKGCQTVFGLTSVTGLRPCNMKSITRPFTLSPNEYLYTYII